MSSCLRKDFNYPNLSIVGDDIHLSTYFKMISSKEFSAYFTHGFLAFPGEVASRLWDVPIPSGPLPIPSLCSSDPWICKSSSRSSPRKSVHQMKSYPLPSFDILYKVCEGSYILSSNYIPQILWVVITCPCSWYLLLAQHSSYYDGCILLQDFKSSLLWPLY